jgi:hypothetical protein
MDHEDWIYYSTAGAEYGGHKGFIASREEIQRIASPLTTTE